MANTSASFRKHVMDVRRSLAALDRSLGVLSASMNGNGAAHTGRARATRRLSPRARAALKLQGRYMGYMRQLKPKQKTLVRALREKSGVAVAIKKAQQLASR